ncbi:hypothetical protein [Mameliella sp.]|uniref:hypothetical protein n=1 Tax=Mameliella sp. TaxID=1924940 RepID=UPI003B51466F
MAKDKTMKALLASIEGKEAEILRLQAQVDALREVYNQEAGLSEEGRKRTGVPVKTTILDLLEKVGHNGLNANIACAMAQTEGIELQPKSVSSLLSRFKSDGTVIHDGAKYYLPKFKEKRPGPTMPAPLPGADVVRPLRTSGQSS